LVALYEEEETPVDTSVSEEYYLVDVKGIGYSTAKNLAKNGIISVEHLLNSDPETLATKINGISSKMINEWQVNAKVLLNA